MVEIWNFFGLKNYFATTRVLITLSPLVETNALELRSRELQDSTAGDLSHSLGAKITIINYCEGLI